LERWSMWALHLSAPPAEREIVVVEQDRPIRVSKQLE
jgi:hypothetical protein